jgi:putative aminopeptidase FrvX
MPVGRSSRSTLLEMLRVLSEADGPPGREDAVRRLAARQLPTSMRHVRVSPLGSLYAERASPRGVRLMLAASLDEAGFIVSHTYRGGIAWLHPSGWIDQDACASAALRFPGGATATLGVIAPADAKTRPRFLADFGMDGRVGELQIGTMGVFATPWQSEKTLVSGKALDGRLGTAIALAVAQRTGRSANTLLLALMPLGQLGHRAAGAAAHELAPDAVIALGVYPVAQKRMAGATDARPGKGPVILLRSEQFVADFMMVEALRQAAARAKIPHQQAVGKDDTAGAAIFQSSLEGIPTAALLIPCTAVGTPRPQADTRDLEAAVELLVKVIGRPLNLLEDARQPR